MRTQLNFCMSEIEIELIRKYAKRDNITVSEFLRRAAMHYGQAIVEASNSRL